MTWEREFWVDELKTPFAVLALLVLLAASMPFRGIQLLVQKVRRWI